MPRGLLGDLKDQYHQLKEFRQLADKPYSKYVKDLRKGNNSHSLLNEDESDENDKQFTKDNSEKVQRDLGGSLSQSILVRNSSFKSTQSDQAELTSLQKRYSSTVRLLAESLEEQSNLRAVVELTSNPTEIDALLAQEDFRLAAYGPIIATKAHFDLAEEEELPVLLRVTKIRALLLEKEHLLQETIDLRTRVDQERAKRAEVEAQLKVTDALYSDSQRDLESAHLAIRQLQQQLSAHSLDEKEAKSVSQGKWHDIFANGNRNDLEMLPGPPTEEEVDDFAEYTGMNHPVGIASIQTYASVHQPNQNVRPPRTPPAVHQKQFSSQFKRNANKDLPLEIEQSPKSGYKLSTAHSFEDYEYEQDDMDERRADLNISEDDLLQSLDGSIEAPNDSNEIDQGSDDAELSDDDFPILDREPTVKLDASRSNLDLQQRTSSSDPKLGVENITITDDADIDEHSHDSANSFHSQESNNVILSIDLDDTRKAAELKVTLNVIPAAAALSFLQKHNLSAEYFEPLVRQIERLQQSLKANARNFSNEDIDEDEEEDEILVDKRTNDVADEDEIPEFLDYEVPIGETEIVAEEVDEETYERHPMTTLLESDRLRGLREQHAKLVRDSKIKQLPTKETHKVSQSVFRTEPSSFVPSKINKDRNFSRYSSKPQPVGSAETVGADPYPFENTASRRDNERNWDGASEHARKFAPVPRKSLAAKESNISRFSTGNEQEDYFVSRQSSSPGLTPISVESFESKADAARKSDLVRRASIASKPSRVQDTSSNDHTQEPVVGQQNTLAESTNRPYQPPTFGGMIMRKKAISDSSRTIIQSNIRSNSRDSHDSMSVHSIYDEQPPTRINENVGGLGRNKGERENTSVSPKLSFNDEIEREKVQHKMKGTKQRNTLPSQSPNSSSPAPSSFSQVVSPSNNHVFWNDDTAKRSNWKNRNEQSRKSSSTSLEHQHTMTAPEPNRGFFSFLKSKHAPSPESSNTENKSPKIPSFLSENSAVKNSKQSSTSRTKKK
jgi:hypothetical protein